MAETSRLQVVAPRAGEASRLYDRFLTGTKSDLLFVTIVTCANAPLVTSKALLPTGRGGSATLGWVGREVKRVLQNIWIEFASAVLLLVLVAWSTRRVSPLWPAVAFALGRGTISYATGATALTSVATGVAAFVLGVLYFWLLKRLQGTRWWWVALVVGVIGFSI
jgi:hypothetical protein